LIVSKSHANPLFPAYGPATGSFNGLHAKSKFLATQHLQSKKMKALLGLITCIAVFHSSTAIAEEDHLFTYQPIITQKDRLNSKGERLADPVAILIQERANAHKNKEADETYFTTPAKRAEITTMLSRGDLSDQMKTVILKANDPVLFITVRRDGKGQMAMDVGMRMRDQDDYEEIEAMLAAELGAKETQASAAGATIDKNHPDFPLILAASEAAIEMVVGEAVAIDGSVQLVNEWARLDGSLKTKSKKDPINEDTDYYFELDLAILLKKSNNRWRVLTHVIASDITASMEIPNKFRDVPKELFPPIPPGALGGQDN
jgi:hypothetical protein